ncbi:hypothetical protein C0993_000920, partial [Termitomyces sp. T159_Od127]
LCYRRIFTFFGCSGTAGTGERSPPEMRDPSYDEPIPDQRYPAVGLNSYYIKASSSKSIQGRLELGNSPLLFNLDGLVTEIILERTRLLSLALRL